LIVHGVKIQILNEADYCVGTMIAEDELLSVCESLIAKRLGGVHNCHNFEGGKAVMEIACSLALV